MAATEKAQHTPGPWFVSDSDSTSAKVSSEDYGGIASLHNPIADETGRTKELHANAELIALAPEMYELLREVNLDCLRARPDGPDSGDSFEGQEQSMALWRRVRALIKKVNPCGDHHYRAGGYCPNCGEALSLGAR